ncbi:MAG: hypothetical protein ABEJ28_02700 [Salinigranum sp.]
MSTALDAALCLLLVSAGAVTVVTHAGSGGPDRASVDHADAVADTLATSTATVNYTLAPGLDGATSPEFERTAHGTLAELLSEAAVSRVAVDGRRVTHAGDDFDRAVRRRVRGATGTNRTGARVTHAQVVVVWRPYSGAHVRSRTVVGESPAQTATVRAATLTAPSGVPAARSDALAAASDGFGAVARVVATRLIEGLVPPDSARFALRGDYPVSALMRARYRRLGSIYDANVSAAVTGGDARAANRRLERAAAGRIEDDLRSEYDTPEAAARALRLDRVRIVVRTWS